MLRRRFGHHRHKFHGVYKETLVLEGTSCDYSSITTAYIHGVYHAAIRECPATGFWSSLLWIHGVCLAANKKKIRNDNSSINTVSNSQRYYAFRSLPFKVTASTTNVIIQTRYRIITIISALNSQRPLTTMPSEKNMLQTAIQSSPSQTPGIYYAAVWKIKRYATITFASSSLPFHGPCHETKIKENTWYDSISIITTSAFSAHDSDATIKVIILVYEILTVIKFVVTTPQVALLHASIGNDKN